jgi:DnaJ family protein A protein 2
VEPGDINFIIQEKDHDLFKRKGADLLAVKGVSLNQALCGFTWKVKHLDGRVLIIKTKPGEVIKPEMNTKEALPFVKVLPDAFQGNPFVRGNLYVMFRVTFPEGDELLADIVAKLKKLMPELEKYDLNPADLRSFDEVWSRKHQTCIVKSISISN